MTSQNECSAKPPRSAEELYQKAVLIQRKNKAPLNQPCNGFIPGFTLAEARGKRRLQLLEESRDKLIQEMGIITDKLVSINAEVRELKAEQNDREVQSGLMDPVRPVGWGRGRL